MHLEWVDCRASFISLESQSDVWLQWALKYYSGELDSFGDPVVTKNDLLAKEIIAEILARKLRE